MRPLCRGTWPRACKADRLRPHVAQDAGAGSQMPPGYRIELAGTAEESSKDRGSIFANVPLMLFLTFTLLLMLQLQSFSRAMLVFLTGPWALPAWPPR